MKRLVLSAAVAAIFNAFGVTNDVDYIDAFVSGEGPEIYVASASVVSVRPCAFAANTGIRVIAIASAKSVGRQSFQGCSSLEEVRLDLLDDASSLSGSFAGCPKLVNVYMQSYEFSLSLAMKCGFPWGASNPGVVFHFKNGDFDRLGRRVE